MLNLPSPPSPPPKNQQTGLDLLVYYRQLWEYHQQAAELASEQMLHYLELLIKQIPDTVDDGKPVAMEAELSLSELDKLDVGKSEETAVTANLNSYRGQENSQYPEIQEIFAANKGKCLHIDYLVWELYGVVDKATQMSVKKEVKKTLLAGEKQGLWYAVPDSPECWTLDLHDFPELVSSASKKSASKLKQTSSRRRNTEHVKPTAYRPNWKISQFPYSQILEQCVTLDVAIEECLILHYPQAMRTEEILQWLYPHGLSPRHRKQVHTAIIETLEQEVNGQSWRQVSSGLYIWNDSN